MDEAHFIAAWPGALAREDLITHQRKLTALEEKRRQIDLDITHELGQIERIQHISAPLAELGVSEMAIRFLGHIRVVDDDDSCWVHTGSQRTRKGSEHAGFRISSEQTRDAHRVAWQLAHPGEPLPPVVRHKCDNPPCCRPKHLIEGTQLDNIQDRVDRGRGRGKGDQRGERNDSATLTDQIVLEARRRYRAGESGGAIARDLGVDVNTLGQALRGNSWTHLDAIEAPVTGRRCGTSLTEDDVRTIRKRAEAGEKHIAIAPDYGVTPANITAIVRRKSWKHVTD